MVSVSGTKTFASAPNGASAPDSITTEHGMFFVEYGNGADSTGAGGSSTIVQYDKAGEVEHTYTIAGSVDGLKVNPYTGQIWALQNQDGNSTLTLIDTEGGTVSKAVPYAVKSATRGIDDVVFGSAVAPLPSTALAGMLILGGVGSVQFIRRKKAALA